MFVLLTNYIYINNFILTYNLIFAITLKSNQVMNRKNTLEIRKMFLEFFLNKNHKILNSGPIIPKNDDTLLFTNAGMNQFKKKFLGSSKISFSRIATSQKCIRAGGKHNDLENVGFTNRHHTFFEMLGNFSFNDYFKREAIEFAWEFLTDKKWLHLEKNKFLVTVHYNDIETYNIWNKKIGLSEEKIIKTGNINSASNTFNNFWQMGDVGPCGYCTEIFYNSKNINISSFKGECDNILEIWNIVFIEFERKISGKLIPLTIKSVDTGMGLERISSIVQGVDSNYKIDLFKKLIYFISKLLSVKNLDNNALKVIADHIRSSVFIISEGIIPSNEGRGYVLRKIIRRAICYAYSVNFKNYFLYKLVKPLISCFNEDLNFSIDKRKSIENVLLNEEKKFFITFSKGINLLENELTKIKKNILPGKIAFKLYDTYGLHLDLIYDICKNRNVKIDKSNFNIEMQKQKNKSKNCSNFKNIKNIKNFIEINDENHFLGYFNNKSTSVIKKIFYKNELVNELKTKEFGVIILDKTPFYPESGGQIGDIGELKGDKFKFLVSDTQKYDKTIGHFGIVSFGNICVNSYVNAKIDYQRRLVISANHSATHLLNFALQKVFSCNIVQNGSLINEKYLRFDFLYSNSISYEDMYKVEKLVNEKIQSNDNFITKFIKFNDAIQLGLCSESDICHGENVRVVKIKDYSYELCCGSHVNKTGDIGLFIIENFFKISNNSYRVKALTGLLAIKKIQKMKKLINNIKKKINCEEEEIFKTIENSVKNIKKLKSLINKLEKEKIFNKCSDLLNKSQKVNGINILISGLKKFNIHDLSIMINILKNTLKFEAIVLSIIQNNKIYIFLWISKFLGKTINSKCLVEYISKKIKGKYIIRPEFLLIVSSSIESTSNILLSIKNWIGINLK